MYGGTRGGGSTCSAGGGRGHCSLHGRITPSGTNSIEVARCGGGGVALTAATFTVYVVEWGEEHQIQRALVTGTAGGDGVDATSEYSTASITAVRRAATWAWASGWSEENGIGDSFNGFAVALGDGVSFDDVEDHVAVGAEYSIQKSVLVTVHTCERLSVEWRFKTDGHGTNATKNHPVASAGETELYDETSNPKTTEGLRASLYAHTMGNTTDRYDIGVLFGRHTDATNLRTTRVEAGTPWAAWFQSIDTVGVTNPDTGSSALHVTRKVLDLSDRVIEVWDARGLSSATWTFTYDYAGRQLSSNHATALGERYALPDAAGNPIWARDARGIEVDRTFDAINRPLEESTDDGSSVKLRRKWTYIPYDDDDPDFATWQSKNIFGRVEEDRDADGLRFFEYD